MFYDYQLSLFIGHTEYIYIFIGLFPFHFTLLFQLFLQKNFTIFPKNPVFFGTLNYDLKLYD
jgi:hypothetical protein